jgi:predicted DNA binding CopG/RHH family protein
MIQSLHNHLTFIMKPNKFTNTANPLAAFAESAPDSGKSSVTSEAKKEKPITLTMSVELIEKLNEASKAVGLSRAAFIKMTLTKALEQ